MAGVLSYALTLNSRAFTSSLGVAGGAVRGFSGGITSLMGKLTSLPVLLAGAAGGAGILGGAFTAFKAAADMESTVTSFSTLLGSTEKATELMGKLNQEAATTPNTLDELAQSTRSLMSVSDDNNLIADLRMIGDLASASQKPITELAAMYAKIKGSDLVQGEDLNMISDALGGKALQEFAKVLNVDGAAAVRKMGSEGKITGAILDQVFRNLTSEGGMAFGAMDAQSKTTNGLLSTLKDNIAGIMRTLGTPLNDLMKPIIAGWINKAATFGTQLQGIFEMLKGAKEAGRLGEFIGTGLQLAATLFINTIISGFQKAFAYVSTVFPAIFSTLSETIFNDQNLRPLSLAFDAIGLKLKAAITTAAAELARAAGFEDKGAELDVRAAMFAKLGAGYLDAAEQAFKDVDYSGIGGKIGEKIEQAHVDGLEKAKSAGNKDFLNINGLLDRLKDMGKEFAPEGLDKTLNPDESKPAKPKQEDRGKVEGIDEAVAEAHAKKVKESDLEEAARKAAAIRLARGDWASEMNILKAKADGNERLAGKLERQAKLEQLKLDLMEKQGMSENDALAAANQRLALEDKIAGKRPRGFKDAAESALARINRNKSGGGNLDSSDRLGLIDIGARRGLNREELKKLSPEELAKQVAAAKGNGKPLTPKRAAEELAKANAAADPSKGRGAAAADPQQKRDDALLAIVKEISNNFANLAAA